MTVMAALSHPKHTATNVTTQYTLDGIDDDGLEHDTDTRFGGHTKNDQRDMQRMGKQQELMV